MTCQRFSFGEIVNAGMAPADRPAMVDVFFTVDAHKVRSSLWY